MIRNGKYIVETLSEQGYEGYFVGGYVRDMLLNQPSNDIDIATNAIPERVVEIFTAEGHTVVPTGIEHGTVTIVIDNVHYEVTTYRHDVSCDGRNATIRYAETLQIDLSRRDFTMNAIAYCPINEEYIDPHNGQRDIENGSIRAVGDATVRFSEDYLRMFRAFRFQSVLPFIIDVDTWKGIAYAVKENWLDCISMERIKMEFDKVMKNSEEPDLFITNLAISGLLEKIMPEVLAMIDFKQNKYHSHPLWGHTMLVLNNVPKEFPLIRWAALFHDLGKIPSREWDEKKQDWTFHEHEEDSVKIASEIMDRLKFSNDDKEEILHLIAHHMRTVDKKMKKPAVRRFIKRIGVDNIDSFMVLKEADKRGNLKRPGGEIAEQMDLIKARIDDVLNSPDVPVFDTNALDVNGKDVMDVLDIVPGPEVGRILRALLELVLDNPELNTKEALLALIKEI